MAPISTTFVRIVFSLVCSTSLYPIELVTELSCLLFDISDFCLYHSFTTAWYLDKLIIMSTCPICMFLTDVMLKAMLYWQLLMLKRLSSDVMHLPATCIVSLSIYSGTLINMSSTCQVYFPISLALMNVRESHVKSVDWTISSDVGFSRIYLNGKACAHILELFKPMSSKHEHTTLQGHYSTFSGY